MILRVSGNDALLLNKKRFPIINKEKRKITKLFTSLELNLPQWERIQQVFVQVLCFGKKTKGSMSQKE